MKLSEIAQVIRSKNAGPRRLTLDIMFASDADYQRVAQSPAHQGYKASLVRLADSLGISKQVNFCGFVPDELARDLLCASDLFVLPTREEGFGLSIAEAQACHVPVLTEPNTATARTLGSPW